MKIASTLLQEAAEYVKQYFAKHLKPEFTFHNFEHTEGVVQACELIAKNTGMDKQSMNQLLIAAWFHDLGYTRGIEDHEESSAVMVDNFLERNQVDEKERKIVKSIILATRMPQSPETLAEQILCDADMHHLGSEDYFSHAKNLRKEWSKIRQLDFTDKKWIKNNIQFISSHQYYTPSAMESFNDKKNANLHQLKKKLKKLKEDESSGKVKSSIGVNLDSPKLERGVETLFRVMADNHMRLSDMADNKSNLLITINALVISIVLSVLVTKLDTNPHLILPTFIIIVVNVVTITIAILATRPKVTAGTFTKDQVKNGEVNLLFFGNFHGMPFGEYRDAMWDTMIDKKRLYSNIMFDIYLLGKVLKKKYHYLKWAYTFFMVGLIVSILSFITTFLFM